jgi:uncharacterized protein (TIGR03118 family)
MRVATTIVLGLSLLATPVLAATSFTVNPLVADKKGAPNIDPDLKNPWGISQFPGAPLWVSDNHTGLSTLYDPNTGVKAGLIVTIPGGAPTGQIALPGGHGYTITEGAKSGSAQFIFATENGAIEGWNGSVDTNNAIIAFQDPNADYKGLAWDSATNHLFAANLAGNSVDVFDNTFTKIGSFTDKKLPSKFAPFNVAVLNGLLYVTFGKKKGGDAAEGPGLGYVDVFTTAGVFQKTLVAKGVLNAPWGLAIGPSNFGDFAGKLLVGNFGGAGNINAFDPSTGAMVGTLSTQNGQAIALQGLWQLDDTGNGSLTFAAGPGREKHGLLGLITPN